MTGDPRFVAGGGEGGLLDQVARVETGFTLHVSNIPVSLSTDGLLNQFCPPGSTSSPLDVKVIPSKLPNAKTTWGFVTYSTEEEAREAAGRLNGQPPFRLRVYPKKTDKEKMAEHEEELRRTRDADQAIQKLEHFQKTQGIGGGGQSEAVPRLSGRTAGVQAAAIGRSGDKQSGPFKPGGTYPDRHQGGYTSASDIEKVDGNSNLINGGGQNASFVHSSSSSGVFRHGAPIAVKIRTPILDCLDCGKEGRVRCSRCKSWYCSQRCQANHWPAHRPDCVPPPPLENPDGSAYVAPSLRLLRQEPPHQPVRTQEAAAPLRPVHQTTQTSPKKGGGPPAKSATPQVSAGGAKDDPKPETHTTAKEAPKAVTPTVKDTPKPVLATKETPKPVTPIVKEAPEPVVPAAKEAPEPVEVPVVKETPKPVKDTSRKPTQEAGASPKDVAPAKETAKPQSATAVQQPPTQPPPTQPPPKSEVPDWIEKVNLDKWAVFSRTNLDDAQVGDVVMMVVNLDRKVTDATTSIVNTPASFAGFCIHGDTENEDSDINFLLQAMDPLYKDRKDAGKLGLPAAARIPGQVVLTNEDDEVARCIIIEKETDDVAAVYGVDIPGKRSHRFAEMMVAPERARMIAGCGYRLTCAEALTPAMTSQIKALAEDSILSFQVSGVTKFASGAGRNRLKKMKVLLLDTNETPLVEYTAVPWYRVGNPRVQELLSVPSEQTFLNDYKSVKLKKGDTVFKIGFGEWANQLICVRKGDQSAIREVDDILTTTILEPLPSAHIPKPRQMVAVRTEAVKSAPAYHRAVVRVVNEAEGKAKVRLLDHGATIIEPLANLAEIPELALNAEKYPAFACMLPIHGVEGAVKMSEGPSQVMMKTLDPIFESGLTVTDIREENRHVLTHPNGKTVGQIITQKIAEPAKDRSRGEIQGMEVGGGFNYEKCTFAELKVDPSAKQEVLVLHVGGPQEVYVTPCDQLAAVDTLMEQVRNYAAATEANFRGFRPAVGRMCVAQASEDKQWYRAACLEENQDKFMLQFVDFGFFEEVPVANILPVDPALMKAPLLANQCVIEGFEGGDEEEMDQETVDSIKELLPANDLTEVTVMRKNEDGLHVIWPSALGEDPPEPAAPAAAAPQTPAPAAAGPPQSATLAAAAATPPALSQAAHVVPQSVPLPATPPALQPPADAAAMMAIQQQMLALQKQLAAMQSPQ